MMKMKKFNDEVYYAEEKVVQVSREVIDFLKQKALENPRKRCRLCTHRDVNDKIHEMIIVHTRDTYVRPHKHTGKVEAFHLIEGLVDVLLFDEQGKIKQVIQMGPYGSGKTFYYKIDQADYHTLLIKSDIVVFHEITTGPFRKEETIFAPWSPEDTDKKSVSEFMKKLSQQDEEDTASLAMDSAKGSGKKKGQKAKKVTL